MASLLTLLNVLLKETVGVLDIIISQSELSLEKLRFDIRCQLMLDGKERIMVSADMHLVLEDLDYPESIEELMEDIRKAGFNVSCDSLRVEVSTSFLLAERVVREEIKTG